MIIKFIRWYYKSCSEEHDERTKELDKVKLAETTKDVEKKC